LELIFSAAFKENDSIKRIPEIMKRFFSLLVIFIILIIQYI